MTEGGCQTLRPTCQNASNDPSENAPQGICANLARRPASLTWSKTSFNRRPVASRGSGKMPPRWDAP
eukprot:97268-Pyramimonas_sp.AAC.1